MTIYPIPHNSDMQPENDPKTGVPYCNIRCISFDGKRCAIIGFKPSSICEPAVRLLVQRKP